MPKKLKKIYPFLLILLNLLSSSNSQNLDKSVLKAAGCLTLVKKLKDKPNDQRVATGLLLSCFINVDEETADKLLQNQFYEKMGIEDSEVMKLIDFNKIQNKYSQEQIEEYSKALNKALDPLRDKGPGDKSGQGPNPYDNEEENSENNGSIVDYIIKATFQDLFQELYKEKIKFFILEDGQEYNVIGLPVAYLSCFMCLGT